MRVKKFPLSNKALPTFLCIGAMKSATTWLYEILKKHPEIYLNPLIKEINFFNRHYNRGIKWYERFFLTKEKSIQYKAIGEISPMYFIDEYAPIRIQETLSDPNFIVVLRNPVDRAFSHYIYRKSKRNDCYSLEQVMCEDTNIFNHGLYAFHLKNWLKVFPKNKFLILIFEEFTKNPLIVLLKISKFLAVDFNKFNKVDLTKKINYTRVPIFHELYKFLIRIMRPFSSKGLYNVIGRFSKLKKIIFLFGEKQEKEMFNSSIRTKYFFKYKDDIEELEKLFNIDLNIWKA